MVHLVCFSCTGDDLTQREISEKMEMLGSCEILVFHGVVGKVKVFCYRRFEGEYFFHIHSQAVEGQSDCLNLKIRALQFSKMAVNTN